MDQMIVQLRSIVLMGGAVLIPLRVVWFVLKTIGGIRVRPEEKKVGLDVGEHDLRCGHFGADTNEWPPPTNQLPFQVGFFVIV